MKKPILSLCAFTLLSFSAFAGAPAPMTMKCITFDTNGRSEKQTIVFEYGMGQQALKLKDAKGIVAAVTDDNEMLPDVYDVKLYSDTSIVTAKGVSPSEDQTHGIHLVQLSGKRAVSVFCGI